MTNLENKAKAKPAAPAKPVDAAAAKPTTAAPAKPATAAPVAAPVAAASTGLKSEKIFGMMATYLNQGLGKDLIPKVASTFGFEILETKGAKPVLVYSINLKEGQGKVEKGEPKGADATFTMTDADFDQVCMGKLNP